MDVLCAWCEKEGTRNLLKTVDGPNDQVSHGICEVHQEEMLKQIAHTYPQKRASNPRRKRQRRK